LKIFIDTANIEDIAFYAQFGIIDGVTTNPALLAKEKRSAIDVVKEIVDIVDGPISVEVVSLDAASMVSEAKQLAQLHENIVVKVPAIAEGLKALKNISKAGIKTNVTMIYTANLALLAAKLGATYVSPFIGRLDATSTEGSALIEEIVTIFDNYRFSTEVLAASMRNSIYVKHAALAGAHAATIPPATLKEMLECELTESALTGFLKQWEELPDDFRKSLFS